MKVWSGTAWAEKPAKVWSGTAWAAKPVKAWTGSAWKTTGVVAPSGPTSWLIISFAPSSARNDFTGEVGMRINPAVNKTFTWIGKLQSGTNTGLHRVRVYEWFADAVVAEAMIDMNTAGIGTYAWKQVAPFTLTGGGYYALMAECTISDGQTWGNTGPITLHASAGLPYDVYRIGAAPMSTGSPNNSYVGVDLGWN